MGGETTIYDDACACQAVTSVLGFWHARSTTAAREPDRQHEACEEPGSLPLSSLDSIISYYSYSSISRATATALLLQAVS